MPMNFSNTPRAQSDLLFGIDLGGTKTEIAVLGSQGQFLHRERRPTPANDYHAILHNIAHLLSRAQSATGIRAQALGIGAPGAPKPESGELKNANTTCLIGQPLAIDLQRLIEIPVVVENDANCFTLSEATDGAASQDRTVFGVILGTGVGGGWFINWHLHTGRQHIAGEWGHNPLPTFASMATTVRQPSRACYCGQRDCIETYLSGPGLSLTYAEIGPKKASADTIANRYMQDEPQAQQAMAAYVTQLAAALATVINVMDPDCIVLGGGLSQMPWLYEQLPRELERFVFSHSVQTKILRAKHGDSSGVRGAAWLSQKAFN
jgi:fructokinase